MTPTQEQQNKDEILTFLKNNDIDPNEAMGFKKKFETIYTVGESRKFAEETKVGFNIVGTSDVNVYLYEINDIEFETAFKVSQQVFKYDEIFETLSIVGADSKKHNEAYKIVINSIYLDL